MANISEWPFPKFLVTPYRTLLISKADDENTYYIAEVYYDGEDWVGFNAGGFDAAEEVVFMEVADFGPFYSLIAVLSDGSKLNYVRDPEEDTEWLCFTQIFQPVFGTHCNFNGQLVGGNISNWQSLGTNAIAWSAIGNYEFDPSVNIVAGFSELFVGETTGEKATVHRIMQLGNKLVVYADAGKLLLSPEVVESSYTLGQKKLPGYGIRSGNHVGGNEHCHGFIDLEGEFWTLEADGMTRRGYKEYMLPIINGEGVTQISYLPREKRFYVSNSEACVVVSEHGAYHSHQLPSSIVRAQDGTLFGTFMDTDDTTALVVTDSLDFDSRGIKSVESLLADYKAASDAAVTMAVDYKFDNRADFTRSSFTPVNLGGEARIKVEASNHRLCIRFSDYTEAELRYLLANVKFSDQRFKRGPVPKQYTRDLLGNASE